MPSVGLGTVVRSAQQLHDVPKTMSTYLEAGGHLIDTAPTYGSGKMQRKLGESLSKWPREQFWLISKIPVVAMGYEKTLRQVNSTLLDLRVSHLDLLLVHRPSNAPGVKGATQQRVTRQLRVDTWRALVDVQRAGLVQHIGVSNHGIVYLQELEEAGLPMPAVNEIELHPWVDTRQWELVRYCRARAIHIIAYNSLGGLGASRSTARVAQLATKYGRTEAQILLRWGIQQKATVIPQASSALHIQQNLAVTNFNLSAEDIALISADPKPPRWASFHEINNPHHVDPGSLECDTAEKLIARHQQALSRIARQAAVELTLHPEQFKPYVIDANEWPSAGLCADSSDAQRSVAPARILGSFIQRSQRPFIVLPRYWDREQVRVMANLADELHAKHAQLYNPSCNASRACMGKKSGCHRVPDGRVAFPGHTLSEQWVPAAGDMRCHWCYSFSSFCAKAKNDEQLIALATAFYESTGSPEPPTVKSVLANAMSGTGANSGGEFHQDEMTVDKEEGEVTPHQMKCLTYLEDVGPSNGPFTMLVGYNRTVMSRKHVLANNIRDIDKRSRRSDKRSHRFNEDTIIEAQRCGEAFLVELHGPAGTVICFDSGNIHRGKPIIQGRRSAVTLYFSSPPTIGLPARNSIGGGHDS